MRRGRENQRRRQHRRQRRRREKTNNRTTHHNDHSRDDNQSHASAIPRVNGQRREPPRHSSEIRRLRNRAEGEPGETARAHSDGKDDRQRQQCNEQQQQQPRLQDLRVRVRRQEAVQKPYEAGDQVPDGRQGEGVHRLVRESHGKVFQQVERRGETAAEVEEDQRHDEPARRRFVMLACGQE